VSLVIHQRDALAAEYRRVLVELKEERLRVWRPVYRNLLRVGADALRRLRAHDLLAILKRHVRDGDGIRQGVHNVSGVAPYGPGRKVALSDLKPSGDRADLFIFSIVNWHYRRQRPQQLAIQFARDRRVFYVEMEPSANDVEVTEELPSLYRVRLPRQAGLRVRAYSGIPAASHCTAFARAFTAFVAALAPSATPQLIVQHPFWWPFVESLAGTHPVVYDCMDDHSGFPNTSRHTIALEAALVQRASALVVSSGYLGSLHAGRPDRRVIRNACDASLLDTSSLEGRWRQRLGGLRESRAGVSQVRVGYVGAISEWLDIELLRSVAIRRPDFDFHLCGAPAVAGIEAISSLPNVRLHGEVGHDEVPAFIGAMDVMVIPFRITPLTLAVDPIKYYEHCALGKPTVATALPELCGGDRPVLIATDHRQFADRIAEARSSAAMPGAAAALREYAAGNTWADRAIAFAATLEDCGPAVPSPRPWRVPQEA
jgi:glycosyltransferase involved in cell wall biosynthesis